MGTESSRGDAPVGPTDTDRSRTLWFALLLTLTNGFMDAHTYFVRGGVFANVQTGNVIFFALDLSERRVTAAMAHLWPILASADVALAPGPHETFGLAALEALASGTPAVVSNTSALAELLTTDSGAAADNDPDSIARAVARIISRPEPFRRYGARRRAEEFTWLRSATGMLNALGAD